MKYGRKKEFVDEEIEMRMGIDNLSTIDKAAKSDPTVNDNLLGDTPIPTKIDENEIHANVGPLQQQVENPDAGAIFDPKKIPAAAKKNTPAQET